MRSLLATLLLMAGCTEPACPPPLAASLRIELLFGRTHPGGQVGDADWRSFLATELTPRFPDGLTAYDAQGQWRDPATGHLVEEASRVVLLLTPDGPGHIEAARDAAEAYRRRFRQDAVGLSVSRSCVGF